MKKIASLLAAVMLLTATLAGCGNSGSGSSTTDTSSASSTASQSSTAEDSSAAEGETSSEASATEAGDYGEFTTIEEGKLIMATNAQFPPYELVSDGEGFNGTGFEGIDVEIASAIADKLGLELQIDDMDFDSALVAVQNDAADVVLAGLSYSEERDEVLDFTDSYATGVQVVIVPEDSAITSVDDLLAEGASHSIGVQQGTTGDIYATSDIEEAGLGTVERFKTGTDAVLALTTGKIDCVIIDNEPAKNFVAANEGLKILDTAYAQEDYAIGVAKGNTELLNAINGALEELKADGALQAIVDKYINAE